MAKKSTVDAYANVAAIRVVEAVAGTLATAKFAFPFSIMDKMALLLSRMEYQFSNPDQLNSSMDNATLALLAASTVVNIQDQVDPLIIDSVRFTRVDYGAAASGMLTTMPIVKDFSNLPGGGILVAPNPLYAAVQGVNAAGVVGGYLRLFYTYMELTADEYWQLVESRRIISS